MKKKPSDKPTEQPAPHGRVDRFGDLLSLYWVGLNAVTFVVSIIVMCIEGVQLARPWVWIALVSAFAISTYAYRKHRVPGYLYLVVTTLVALLLANLAAWFV